jgi:hypothetical protein
MGKKYFYQAYWSWIANSASMRTAWPFKNAMKTKGPGAGSGIFED